MKKLLLTLCLLSNIVQPLGIRAENTDITIKSKEKPESNNARKEKREKNGWKMIDNDWYMFEENKMLKNKWIPSSEGRWYYLDEEGKMVTHQKTIDGVSYYFGTDGIMKRNGEIIQEDNISWHVSSSYRKDIESLPQFLKGMAKEFQILNTSMEKKFDIAIPGTIVGVYFKGIIYLKADKYYPGIVLHESLHAYDDNARKEGRMSDTFEFKEAYGLDFTRIPFDPLNSINEAEAFVECALVYIEDKDKLKQICPNIYQYFVDYAFKDVV